MSEETETKAPAKKAAPKKAPVEKGPQLYINNGKRTLHTEAGPICPGRKVRMPEEQASQYKALELCK